MTSKSSLSPIHAKPPVLGAIPTAMGWRHPHTNELLVSVRGLLDLHDNGSAPVPAVIQSTVSSQEGEGGVSDVVVNSPTESSLPDGALDTAPSPVVTEPGADGTGAAGTSAENAPADVKQESAPAPAPAVDNSLFKFEKTGDDGVVKVTLRAPNHHAYTKWVVDGAEVEGARGNTVDIKVGALFTANNAKGSFSGQAIAAE